MAVQIITNRRANEPLAQMWGYIGRNVLAEPHKHQLRATLVPMFFFVGFVCRTCDHMVLVERGLWYSWMRGDKRDGSHR